MSDPIRLNLGGGTDPACQLEGFINVDRKSGGEIYPVKLPAVHPIPENDQRLAWSPRILKPGTVDEIYAAHCLEHLSAKDAHAALAEWVGLLKPGGRLRVAVPNFAWVCEQYLKGEPIPTAGYVMGGQTDPDDFHRSIWDEEHLRDTLGQLGLRDIKPWKSEINDCASLPVSLNLEGVKRDPVRRLPPAPRPFPKTVACMSMPRLCFTETMFVALEIAVARNLAFEKHTGAWWEQGLTRLIETHLDDGTEWVLTCDYDTKASVEDFDKLCAILLDNPHVDAIVPVQIKRDESNLLMGLLQPDGTPYPHGSKITLEHFEPNLVPISWGHFGFTLFRMEAFRRMTKPWFRGDPDPNGGWGEGRVDPDIYFWRNFAASGNKAFLASRVPIGHVQLVCTYPDQNLQPRHASISEMHGAPKPEWVRK